MDKLREQRNELEELNFAICKNNMSKVRKLVQSGLEINQYSDTEPSPLKMAVLEERKKIALYLCMFGANPNLNENRPTAMQYALLYGRTDYFSTHKLK
jgi:ankyrin repeat protein